MQTSLETLIKIRNCTNNSRELWYQNSSCVSGPPVYQKARLSARQWKAILARLIWMFPRLTVAHCGGLCYSYLSPSDQGFPHEPAGAVT